MSLTVRLNLHFDDSADPSLSKVTFFHPLLEEEILSVRGRTGGVFDTTRTFQWTAAVQALSIVILRTVLTAKKANDKPLADGESITILQGGHGSLAASLDYAIDKQPAWLTDMFGASANGSPLSRKVFKRTNPGRRMKGPVSLALNTTFIEPDDIAIFLQDSPLEELSSIEQLLSSLEEKTGLSSLQRNADGVITATNDSLSNTHPEGTNGFPASEAQVPDTYRTPFILNHIALGPVLTRLYESNDCLCYAVFFYDPFSSVAATVRPVRIQLSCQSSEILEASDCDCRWQLNESMNVLKREGGLLLYLYNPRQRTPLSQFSPSPFQVRLPDLGSLHFVHVGENSEKEQISFAASILKELGLNRVRNLTNNEDKSSLLKKAGIEAESTPLVPPLTPQNLSHLYSKAFSRGHTLREKFSSTSNLLVCSQENFKQAGQRVWILAGDDTLWEDNVYYEDLARQFIDAVSSKIPDFPRKDIRGLLDKVSFENISANGFGPHVFEGSLRKALEAIEARTGKQLPRNMVDGVAEKLLQIPIRVFPEAEDLLWSIHRSGELVILFTQGPFEVQLKKIAQLTLSAFFHAIAIVHRKGVKEFHQLVDSLNLSTEKIVVVGNNMDTEIYPSLEAGLETVYFNNPNGWSMLNRTSIKSGNFREVRKLREIITHYELTT